MGSNKSKSYSTTHIINSDAYVKNDHRTKQDATADVVINFIQIYSSFVKYILNIKIQRAKLDADVKFNNVNPGLPKLTGQKKVM